MVLFCFNFVPYGRLINSRYPAGQKEVLTWIASSLEIYFLNHCHQFLLLSIKCLWGSCESHEFLKKSWNLHSYFPELEKVWKIEVKSGKMEIFIFIRGSLLNQSFFFFFKGPTIALQVIFYRFGQILFNLARILQCIVKKALFPCFLRSVLMAYLITWGLEKKLFFLLLFSVRTPCLVGQSWSLYRTEGIRLEIIMSMEKNRFICFYIGAQSCFHVLSLIHYKRHRL